MLVIILGGALRVHVQLGHRLLIQLHLLEAVRITYGLLRGHQAAGRDAVLDGRGLPQYRLRQVICVVSSPAERQVFVGVRLLGCLVVILLLQAGQVFQGARVRQRVLLLNKCAPAGHLALQFALYLRYPLLRAALLHGKSLSLARRELVPDLLRFHDELPVHLVPVLLGPRVDELPATVGFLLVRDSLPPLSRLHAFFLLWI